MDGMERDQIEDVAADFLAGQTILPPLKASLQRPGYISRPSPSPPPVVSGYDRFEMA